VRSRIGADYALRDEPFDNGFFHGAAKENAAGMKIVIGSELETPVLFDLDVNNRSGNRASQSRNNFLVHGRF